MAQLSGTGALRLSPLTSDDRDALASFPCRHYKAPWTDVVQEMVQHHLAGALHVGAVDGLGLWRDDELVGVAAWQPDPDEPDVVVSVLLAVRYVRRGYGRLLKAALLDRAREIGATAVRSRVHFDNDAMIELNVRLGANVERIDGDDEYLACVIPL